MLQRHRTGGFEDLGGYSRAVRAGGWIAVSATAATDDDGSALHPGDIHTQTQVAFERALDAVAALGGRPDQVVRTRLYLLPGSGWRGAIDAHRELFGAQPPANSTFFVGGFIPHGVLVEVEVDAFVGGDSIAESK